jgi:hypothetical protein
MTVLGLLSKGSWDCFISKIDNDVLLIYAIFLLVLYNWIKEVSINVCRKHCLGLWQIEKGLRRAVCWGYESLYSFNILTSNKFLFRVVYSCQSLLIVASFLSAYTVSIDVTSLFIPCIFIIELLSKNLPTVMHRLMILKRYYKVIPFSGMFLWWPQPSLGKGHRQL